MISRPPSFETSMGSSRSRRTWSAGGVMRDMRGATYPLATVEVKRCISFGEDHEPQSRPLMQIWTLALAVIAAPLVAQSSGSLDRAAATITGAQVMRRISIIADDS